MVIELLLLVLYQNLKSIAKSLLDRLVQGLLLVGRKV